MRAIRRGRPMRTKAMTVVGGLCVAAVTVVAAVGCSRPTSASQETAPPDPQNWVELAVHNFGAPINSNSSGSGGDGGVRTSV